MTKPTPEVPTRRGVSFNPRTDTYCMRTITETDQVGDYVNHYSVATYGSINAAFNAACHDQKLVWGESDRHKARVKLNLPYLPMNKRHHIRIKNKVAVEIPANPWDVKVKEQDAVVKAAQKQLDHYKEQAAIYSATFMG